MIKDDKVSDEQLDAFTDGELEPDEENRIFTLSEQCPELDARLCQQRKLKEMVQHAYRDVPGMRRGSRGRRPGKRLAGLAAAAALVLAVGMAAGWFGARTLGDSGANTGAALAAAPAASDSWLLHVSSADQRQMQAALRRAEELMSARDALPGRRVEVVANEGGLDLLRSDRSPFEAEVRDLADRGVLFFACARAIERLEEQGVPVQLLPDANTRYSALDRVVLRLQEGWTYQKI